MYSNRIVHAGDDGVTQYLSADGEGNLTLKTTQDVESVVEANKAEFNEHTSLDRWGDGRKVASIPLSIFYSPEFQKIRKDQKALRAWLNHPDNRLFRTRPGSV